MHRTLGLGLALVLCASAGAQSVNVDFGPPSSPFGAPGPAYGAAGEAGVWNEVSTAPAGPLVDVLGAPTNVELRFSAPPQFDACGDAATSGDDEALYDDRWFFDPVGIVVTIRGLAPGAYRVHAHVLVESCVFMFSPLEVALPGATPPVDVATATPWPGAPVDGRTYTTQYASVSGMQDLVLDVSAPAGFVSFTQLCGLQIVQVDAPAPFCSGDGSGTACPCANVGAMGRGCENSFTTGGGLLRATFGGLASVVHDSIELNVSGLPPSTSALFFQGTTRVNGGAGSTFGDGLRCAGGSVIRLATKLTAGGASTYPAGSEPPVSVRGRVPANGGTRTYQVWYRNSAAFCTPDGFNLTNGLELAWGP